MPVPLQLPGALELLAMVFVLGSLAVAVLLIGLLVRWSLGRSRREKIEELERRVEELEAERE